jgi:hypothetical protein
MDQKSLAIRDIFEIRGSGILSHKQAQAQLVALGVHPSDAAELLMIATGWDDVIENPVVPNTLDV